MRLIGKRQKPLVICGNSVLTCHKGSIFLVDIKSGASKRIASLPMKKTQRILTNIRLFERLLRNEARNGLLLSKDECLFTYKGSVFHLNMNSGILTREKKFENGMNNPLGLTLIQGIDGFDDCITYGEYVGNENRKKTISIYTRPLEGGEWSKAYEFEPGKIRHVHGIKVIGGKVYLLTGDFGNEAGIWICKNNFRTVTPILTGEQKYRTVQMFGYKNGFIYASDTALEQNYIYTVHDGIAKQVMCINGSCLSATEGHRHYFFSTTVEADESIRGWKSWISRKRGPGILSNCCQIIAIDKENLSSKVILEYEKDVFPFKLFQYGQFYLSYSQETEELLVYPVATKTNEGNLLSILESSIK